MLWHKRLLIALISPISLIPVGFLIDEVDSLLLNYVLIGGIFGLFVLAPFIGAKSMRAVRIIGLILGSIAIYALAVEFAVRNHGLDINGISISIIFSGLLGAVLVGLLTKLVAPIKVAWKYWSFLMLAGLVGGYIFSLFSDASNGYVMSIAYGAWQIPVCLALHFGQRSKA